LLDCDSESSFIPHITQPFAFGSNSSLQFLHLTCFRQFLQKKPLSIEVLQ
jgi:hypothetical protein